MKCPFLKDASVKSCEATAYRKMLLTESTDSTTERCSSSAYAACAIAALRLDGHLQGDRCPFLHEAHAEFCSEASVTKFIPANTDLLSRCNSDRHLYCELFLARLGHDVSTIAPIGDEIAVPPHLWFAPNHMWLDVSEDGSCHVGIDAFAARVLGPVERVTYVTGRTLHRPIAILTVNGVDVQMVFPNPLNLTGANVYLRTATEKLTHDPYGAGWLFEAIEPASRGTAASDALREGLLNGPNAVAWMQEETARLNDYVHQRVAARDADGMQLMADGGHFHEVAPHLDREELLNLVSEFFPSPVGWRRSS